MADISQELSAIKNSVYGKNMRTAIHDAIKKVNEDGGGGGGSGGATIDTLWSDSNGATVETENTMTGNINDYDVIYLKISPQHNVTTYNAYGQYSFLPSMVSSGEVLNFDGYAKRYIQIQFNADKFTVLRAAATDEQEIRIPVLWQIVGIKF